MYQITNGPTLPTGSRADCLRILCEDSHSDLKKYENDWCMCYQESLNCGDLKTCIALQLAVCCCEARIGLPTNSETTVPWIFNCLGLTLWYQVHQLNWIKCHKQSTSQVFFCAQWSFPCSCFSTIGELKEATATDEMWCPDCCAVCCAPATDVAEEPTEVVSSQPVEQSHEDS